MSEAVDITRILEETTRREAGAVDRLFPVVYDELRRLAGAYLRGERSDHTLQATALVHEAYVRLVDQTRVDWKNRSHFVAVAATAMRRVLIDHARQRGRIKRGGGQERVTLDESVSDRSEWNPTDLLALDEALTRLGQQHPEKVGVVEMRFFGGLTVPECAEVMRVNPRTIERYWAYAQAWLYRELAGDGA